ncbi:MAG: response regulator [Oliverpabstia sp.]|nr:response regulator [Oliverpabstia sp.]
MYRVLLVDDEILVRDAIKARIDWNSLGYELAGDCQNGKEAIEFVQNHPVDVVLTDICMPYVDGMELSRFLHVNYPEILIIIFSGFGEFEYAKKAIQYHVSEYLLKPITAVELSEVLLKMKKKLESAKQEEQKMKRLKKASQEYRKNEQMIRSQAISSLVTCVKDPEKCVHDLEAMGIVLDASYYRVAVLSIDLYSELHEQSMVQRQESALMAFVVYNISDEIVSGYQAGIAYQENNNRTGILFQTNRPKEFLQTVQNICTEIQEKIYETMKLRVSIAVGNYVKNTEELHLSYDSASEALSYRYLLGESQIFDLEIDDSFENEISLYNELFELADAVRKGQRKVRDKILEEIRVKIVASRVNKSRACLYLQQVVRTLGDLMDKVHSDTDQVREERSQLLSKMSEQRTFAQAFEVVCGYAEKVGMYLELENSSSGKRQAMEAVDYIRENYADPNLNLSGICMHLGISTSYFSSVFKEETGETFMEFLIRTRMEKARELLEHTSLKNYEIAERVGFADPHYFGISFKKMTGQTPTEYAKRKRQ